MFEIITAIDIDAPPAIVWEQIIDLPAWADWHPYLAFESGEVEHGSTLKVVFTLEDGSQHRMKTVVTQVGPDFQFCWTGEIQEPQPAKGVHCFKVVANGSGSTFHQTETVTGPLSETEQAPQMKENGENGFRLSNEAFKKYVESR